MSNKKRIKRPFRQVGPKNPSIELMTAVLTRSAGVFLVEVRHDDGCPTITSQREEQCICNDTEHVLLKFDPSMTEGQ